MLSHPHSMPHHILEFAAVFALALLSRLFHILGLIAISDVAGVIAICAGLSTIFLNYKRHKKLTKDERVSSKDN